MAAAATAISLSLVSLRPRGSVFEAPLSEDGFYLLSVARNLAIGNGLTIDGEQLTNGFQPLFTFLVTPVYMLTGGDQYLSLNGVLAIHWLVHIATALVLGLIVDTFMRDMPDNRRRAAVWGTVLLWLVSAQVMVHGYNGLETGLLLLLYALVWRAYQIDWVHGWGLAAVGLLLGLLVLTRIDAAVFVAVLVVAELVDSRRSGRDRVARAATLGLLSLLVSLPWWFYNQVWFGSLMPSSGTAQGEPFTVEHFQWMRQAVLNVWTPYQPLSASDSPPGRALLIEALQVIWLAFLASAFVRLTLSLMHKPGLRFAGVLAVSTTLLSVYYMLTSGSWHFYARYIAPFMLLAVPIAAIVIAQRWRFGVYLRTAFVVCVALFFVLTLSSWRFADGGPSVASSSPYYWQQLKLVQDRVPAGETVGAGQSGTLGYFRDDVVNLDGKVNTEVLSYGGDILRYLEAEDIRWYCDWPAYTQKQLGDAYTAAGWIRVAELGDFELLHRP